MRGRSLRGALGRCLASSRRWLPGLVAILLLGGWPLAVAAQEEAPAPADSVPAGGEAGPMAEPCEINCTVYAVDVTPDGQSVTLVPHTSGTRHFTVLNRSSGPASFTFTCTSTGGVTCGTVSPGALAMARNSDDIVTVGYSVGATGGTLTLTATGHATDAGSYVFAAPAAPSVQFTHLVRDHLDRGACFTTGAGEAAGVSCGDLFVVHGMPAYRTLGRDRALSLYYNSAAATGLALVAAKVTQPAGAPTPTSVKVVLSVGGTARDSATYNGFTGSKQVVLGLGRGTIGSLPTGIHPVTLAVKNVFSGSVAETIVTDELLVINRAGSEYGQGWSLLGVEQLVLGQPANAQGRARLLWLAGDGSARVYTDTTGGGSVYHGAPGEAPDSLVRYWHQPPGASEGSWWYRRDLKHGVKVFFDEAGRHRETHNRVGAVTTFQWDAAGERLDSITVPPNDNTSRRYRLFWHPVTARLDSITDPGGRKLGVTMAANGTVTRLTDPDGLATRFAYTAGRLATRVVPRNAAKGDSAVTRYAYGTSATHGRLTKVEIQADSVQTQWTTTVITPWDHQGLATSPTSTQTAATITHATYGIATRVDGPLAGTGDAADVWVNRYGQPTRTTHLGLNTTTTVEYAQNSVPLLPTKITYPTGRTVAQTYDSLGHLTGVYDTIPAWNGAPALPARRTTYTYGDPDAPDAPSSHTVWLGNVARRDSFAFNGLGLLELAIAPTGHRTTFGYIESGPAKGLMTRTVEHGVETWRAGFGDTVDALDSLVTEFHYDADGDLTGATDPTGVRSSYAVDGAGRTTDVYGPLGERTRYVYDAMNRVLQTVQYTTSQSHPGEVDPLDGCNALVRICADVAESTDSLPATLVTTYRYGPVGIDTIIDARGVRRWYGYTPQGQVAAESDVAGTRKAVYATTGLLQRRVSPALASAAEKQDTVAYGYDAVGRVAEMRSSTWSFNGSTVPPDTVRYTYNDELGLVTSTTNRVQLNATGTMGSASIARTYYADGSVRTETRTLPAGTHVTTFEYDAAGAVKRATRNNHGTVDVVDYFYGGSTGELDSLVVAWAAPASGTRTLAFEWDALGRRREVRYPNGVTAKYRYDAGGTLRRLVATNPGTTNMKDNFDFAYRVDSVDVGGRALAQTWQCPEIGGAGQAGSACGESAFKSVSSRYSRLGMLTFQNFGGHSEAYRYDAGGNLRWRRIGIHEHVFRMEDTTNRLYSDSLAGSASSAVRKFDYFANGARKFESIPAGVARRYYYDGFGRPSGVRDEDHPVGTAGCMQYDGENNLVGPCETSPWLVYGGPNVIATLGGPWAFIQGGGVDDPLIGIYRASGMVEEYYWITDGAGRQFAAAPASGYFSPDSENRYFYQAGRFAAGTHNAHGFAQSRMESPAAPGVSFFRNRLYDQATGRWLQEDPIGVAGGLNLYQFNGNDPVSHTDPFGLCCDLVKFGITVNLVHSLLNSSVGKFLTDWKLDNPVSALDGIETPPGAPGAPQPTSSHQVRDALEEGSRRSTRAHRGPRPNGRGFVPRGKNLVNGVKALGKYAGAAGLALELAFPDALSAADDTCRARGTCPISTPEGKRDVADAVFGPVQEP